jgi:starch-binding outer membrane protein, SusD/RagB family
MKHTLLFGSLVMGVLALSSCSKFLQESPKSSQPVDAYYQTIQQVQSAVNYLYNVSSGPGSFFNVGGLYDGTNSFTFDNMSGLANNLVAQNPSIRYFASLTQTPANSDSYLDGIWASLYSSIASANTVISRTQANPSIDSVAAAPLLATARYFRAMDYYYLVRLFGSVPLVLQPYTSLNGLYTPRTSVDSVYASIVSDLTWAYNNGGLADKPMGGNGNQVSRGTVGGVLAEVYLTMAGYPLQGGQGDYTQALAAAGSVLSSSGGYALFDNSAGTTPFEKLRLTSYDQGSEYLYFIEYNSAIQQSAYPEYSLPNTFPLSVPNSNLQVQYTLMTQAWTPATELLNLYDSVNDIRRHEKQFYSSSFVYQSTATGLPVSIPYSFMPYRWFDSVAIFSTAASGKYTAVYRLADVYLIAAEAANELNQDPTPYLQPIIGRAYVNPPAIPSSQSDRRSFILAERYRELAMEGHFWFDMLRTRLYPDADALHNVTFSALVGHSNGRGQTFGMKDLLMPLPPTEIQRDPNLTPQNPGY